MKKLALVGIAVLFVVGLVAGCSSSSDDKAKNFFKGRWQIPEFGAIVEFGDKTVTLSGPAAGSGNYSYQGEYPDFVLTITSEGESESGNVHFLSEAQFRACFQGDCALFNKM